MSDFLVVVIPGDPLKAMSPNRSFWNGRARWAIRKNWRDKAARCFRELGAPGFLVPVNVTMHVYRARRLDPDNATGASKGIWDGLVNAGMVPDDSDRWLKHQPIVWHVGKEGVNPRLEILVEAAEGGVNITL